MFLFDTSWTNSEIVFTPLKKKIADLSNNLPALFSQLERGNQSDIL